MKLKKKTYSLVTKEIFKAINSLLFILMGIFKLTEMQNPVGKYWGGGIAAVIFISWGIEFFVKYDIEDEAAIEHYNKAKKNILELIFSFLSVATVVVAIGALLAERRLTAGFSVNINVWHLLIVCELISLAISACFIYYEKRGV